MQLSRSRTEHIEQILMDIQNYYGYNEFLAEKLFHLFPVLEVRGWPILAGGSN